MYGAMFGLLVACVLGFLSTSGVLEALGGGGSSRAQTAALQHALPVLLALAAPVVCVGFGLLLVTGARRVGWVAAAAIVALAVASLGLLAGAPGLAGWLGRA